MLSSPVVTVFSSLCGLAVHKITVKLLSCCFLRKMRECNMCSDLTLMNKHEITESAREALYFIFSKILGNPILNYKVSGINGP